MDALSRRSPLIPRSADLTSASRRHALAASACLLALFLTRAAAASLIVPYWQGPDEPAHFIWAELLAEGDAAGAGRPDLERSVLQSMAQHHWWQLYGEPVPAPLPTRIAEVPAHLAIGSLLHPAYYWAGAAVLRVVPTSGVDADYAVLRWFSIVLSAIALICGWLGTRLLFGDLTALAIAGVAALHPQYLLTAISVNPDVLIILAGALAWWQVGRLYGVPGVSRVATLVLIAAAGVVAAMAKRNGLPLVVVAVAIIGVEMVRGRRPATVAVIGGAAAMAALALYVSWDRVETLAGRHLTFWSYAFIPRRTLRWEDTRELLRFATSAIDSAWLSPGWLRIPVPEAWLWVVRALTIAGFIGSLVAVVRDRAVRRWLLLAWVVFLIQVGPILLLSFTSRASPQGRYLFAAFFPAVVLLWFGLRAWLPVRARPVHALALLLVAAALDISSFATVLIPAYIL